MSNVDKIIDNILLCVDLEGDGGCSSFDSEEKEEMRSFMNGLKSIYGSVKTIECYECDTLIKYTDKNIIEGAFVKCTCCGKLILIL